MLLHVGVQGYFLVFWITSKTHHLPHNSFTSIIHLVQFQPEISWCLPNTSATDPRHFGCLWVALHSKYLHSWSNTNFYNWDLATGQARYLQCVFYVTGLSDLAQFWDAFWVVILLKNERLPHQPQCAEHPLLLVDIQFKAYIVMILSSCTQTLNW